jgi:predicted metal-dependent RNase
VARPRLTFLGAAGGVTGSCTLLETARARVLLDFGLFRGGRWAERRNRRPPGFDAPSLDAVVLSHAHLDHSGLLPLLPGLGCRAPIRCTPATRDLCGILLPDAAHVQAHDARRWDRRRRGRERQAVREDRERPLYELADVGRVLEQVLPLPYGRAERIAPGVELPSTTPGTSWVPPSWRSTSATDRGACGWSTRATSATGPPRCCAIPRLRLPRTCCCSSPRTATATTARTRRRSRNSAA